MSKARKDNNGQILIFCPGCKHAHAFNIEPAPRRHVWSFNGDFEKPTFSPSMLCTTGHYVQGQPSKENCYFCKDAEAGGYKSCCGVCHSYVRNGMIEFLNDCTHELAGQTVPLGDL